MTIPTVFHNGDGETMVVYLACVLFSLFGVNVLICVPRSFVFSFVYLFVS